MRGEAAAQAGRGPHGSENADMSSERRVKDPVRWTTKGSRATFIVPG